MTALSSSRLRRLAQAPLPGPAPAEVEFETCELCGRPVAAAHRHLLDLRTRDLMCTCPACKILFDRGEAGGGHYRLVPERRVRLDEFEMDDVAWEELRVPVDMAFFFRASAEDRVMAFYPSPMGPTESLLGLEAWSQLEEANSVLREMTDDVEALLVNRAHDARQYWIVPIEDCYALVGLIRTRWRGFTGGKEVWEAIGSFFGELDDKARKRPVRGDTAWPT